MRRFFSMPPQIFRLILLVVGIVVSYSTARYFLTPASFRQYGWYRGDALAELSSRQIVFAGRAACEECHSDHMAKLKKYAHKNLSCESCHGAAQAHVDNPDVKLDKPGYTQCLRCHEANPTRPKTHKQIVSKDHYAGSKCNECHVPHAPSEVP